MTARNKLFLFVAVLFIAMLTMHYVLIEPKKRQQNFAAYEKFMDANIDGVIDSVYNYRQGVRMDLRDGSSFHFYPRTNERLNEGKQFRHAVSPGDAIVKAPGVKVVQIRTTTGTVLRYEFMEVMP